MAQLALTVLKANTALLDTKETQEHPARLVLQARSARMVWTVVAMVVLESTESPASKEKMVVPATMDVMESTVFVVLRATKATLVIKELLDCRVFEAPKATRAIPVLKVLVALKDCRALVARQVQTATTVWQ